jgi:hypothetical protein
MEEDVCALWFHDEMVTIINDAVNLCDTCPLPHFGSIVVLGMACALNGQECCAGMPL